MNIILCGYSGHMGAEVEKLAGSGYKGAVITGGIDVSGEGREYRTCNGFSIDDDFTDILKKADCVIDFSHHSCTSDLMSLACEYSLPVVLCTTGQTEEELSAIDRASQIIPVFRSANMSIGVAVLIDLAKKAVSVMNDAEVEIIEIHHDRKLDAPSGTALMLAEAIKKERKNSRITCGRSGHGKREHDEIGIQSVRIGNGVGVHEIMIGTKSETLTLKHEAHDRALFAEGAIAAAEVISGKKAGLYNMEDMMALL